MPGRLYTTTTRPPTFRDHVFAHPVDLAVALLSTLSGLALVLTVGTPYNPSWPVAQLNDAAQASLGAALILGGIGVGLGLLWWGNEDIGWLLERIGCVSLAIGWALFAAACLFLRPESSVSAALPTACTIGYSLRLVALHYIERRTRGVICKMGGKA